MAEINSVDDFIGAVARGESVFSSPVSDCYAGSRFTQINDQITTGCISPEARDLLDTIMEEWKKQVEQSKQVLPADKIDTGDHYRFAYWLVRWSGLVRPA